MGGRTTRQRKAIRRVLAGCQDFVSAQELHALLVAADHSIGLTTVYRALRELEASGGVDVVRDGAGERLYRQRPADGHRLYLMCRSCGRSQPVDSEAVEQWAGQIAADTGFAAVEHTIELAGICLGCRLTADEGEPPMSLGSRPGSPGPSPHLREPTDTLTARARRPGTVAGGAGCGPSGAVSRTSGESRTVIIGRRAELVPRQATFARQGAASGACSRRAGRKSSYWTYLGFRPVRREGVPGVATGRTLPVGALAPPGGRGQPSRAVSRGAARRPS